MRQPRLLALLIALAALLAFGAWRLVREGPAAALGGSSRAPAIELQRVQEAALEASAPAARQEEPAAKVAPVPNSSRIRGRVVRGPNAFPVAGLEVRCTKEMPPMRIEGPVVLDGDGRTIFGPESLKSSLSLSRTSGPDGSFEFDELERGALYTLEAHGRGWLLVQPLAEVAPSEDERVLAVQRIYTARVLATGEDGKALQGDCEFLRYARVAQPGECESVPVAEWRTERPKKVPLSPELEPAPDPAARSYTFASDCDEARLGPFRVLVACPGFERQDFEFWAYPEGSGAEVTPFVLQRAAAVMGLLRVVQDCGCEGSSCAHLLEGSLELEPLDPDGKRLTFDLTGLVREQVFANIPGGTWHVRARARVGGYMHPPAGEPPLEIVVGSGTSVVHIPVEKLGALRWQLRGTGAGRPGEPVELAWRGGDGSAASFPLWMSAVMRGLEQGPQTFEIDADKVASLEGASGLIVGKLQRVSVEVAAGETKTVVVHTP